MTTLTGHPFPARQDLVFEGTITMDVNGNYIGSTFFDSTGINALRVAMYDVPVGLVVTLYEYSFVGDTSWEAGDVISTNAQTVHVTANGQAYSQLPLTGRFFVLGVSGGLASANYPLVMRAV
jgi:hypothetical protein